MTDEIFEAACKLVLLLREQGLTLSAAESCTGGWFAKSVVDVPGASAVFAGGVVSYINEIKASTPDTPIKIGSVKKGIGENSTTTYYVYYMPSASEVFKLPNDKYTYTVMDAGDGGYIVTYCKADKK